LRLLLRQEQTQERRCTAELRAIRPVDSREAVRPRRARVPSKAVPSKNETWPKGLPEGALTVAVRAKVDPTCGAAGRGARLVVVVIPFTTTKTGAEVPGADLASP